jgi:general secretion pathway protein N
MGRIAAVVIFLLVLAVVALALQAPASWLAHRLSLATHEKLQLIDPQGTVWNGRGALTSPDGRWQIPVAWRLQPQSLLQGEVVVVLEPANGADTPRGALALRPKGYSARGLVIDLPATVLESAFAGGPPLAFGGELRVEAPNLVVDDESGSGQAIVRWDRARLAAPDGTSVSLGRVTATLSPRERGLGGPVRSEGGDVAIAGEIAMRPDGVRLNATLTPRPDAPAEVARALQLLGAPDGAGAVQLDWTSRR